MRRRPPQRIDIEGYADKGCLTEVFCLHGEDLDHRRAPGLNMGRVRRRAAAILAKDAGVAHMANDAGAE